ncbi:hypothetical protein PVAND_001728 [Polypedilum vanderplanki]|uniref:NF-kappa-B-repressing factor-like protein n=1 Tax=Polypedilum vanderplanki TaxID=319348 RepID=A0A9J6BQ49_POLVA|nr:hypothetical protein PVAND_001728 [Polypedilum vanderplanki]
MSSIESSDSEYVDFNKYRKEYESDEHFLLKRKFMEKYWDEYEEEEVLCYTQLFANIEFLRCTYSPEVMQKIHYMTAQVPEIVQYRKKRKNNLKRCLVSATNKTQTFPMIEKNKPIQQEEKEYESKQKQISVKKMQNIIVNRDITHGGCNAIKILDSDDEEEKNRNSGWDDDERKAFKSSSITPSIKFTNAQKAENLRNLLRDVILFDDDESNPNYLNFTLNKTLNMMKKVGKVELKYDNDTNHYYYLFNDQIIGEGNGTSKKLAKKTADEDLVQTLKQNCFRIRSKLKFWSAENVIEKKNLEIQSSKVPQSNQKLQENNLGFKMLKALGWRGGSLGTGNGIIDPINLEIKIGRLGLGSDIQKFDIKYFRNILENFKHQNCEYDLVFSKDFTKEERAKIHQIAAQLHLKTKSYGKNNERHLVISTRISPQVLRQKLLEGDVYLKEKYDIYPPQQQSSKKNEVRV